MGKYRLLAIREKPEVAYFFEIGGEVYRSGPSGLFLDTEGLPMGRRWECSLAHFERYRPMGVFGDLIDPADGLLGGRLDEGPNR